MGKPGWHHVTASRPLGMVIFRFPSAADERGAMIPEVLEAALFPFFPSLVIISPDTTPGYRCNDLQLLTTV